MMAVGSGISSMVSGRIPAGVERATGPSVRCSCSARSSSKSLTLSSEA